MTAMPSSYGMGPAMRSGDDAIYGQEQILRDSVLWRKKIEAQINRTCEGCGAPSNKPNDNCLYCGRYGK